MDVNEIASWLHSNGADIDIAAQVASLDGEQLLECVHQLLQNDGSHVTSDFLSQYTQPMSPQTVSMSPDGISYPQIKKEFPEPARSTKPIATGALPMSAFYPLAKIDVGSVRSTCSHKLQILKQPPTEVTKAVYVELQLRLTTADGTIVDEFVPSAKLVYEDNSEVTSQSGHDVLEGIQTLRDGICILKVRINELSKAHRNQRFKVCIAAKHASFGQAVTYTTAMRVLSKTSIILQHKAALEPEEVATLKSRTKRKHTTEDDQDDSEVVLKKHIVDELQKVHLLVKMNQVQMDALQQRTMHQIAEVKAQIAGFDGRLSEIRDLLLALQK
eukprot:TRINITY_DN14041_c0_g1_i1.p1 TRINITY_DN14041_c0_g1~~TRINITY_DN14041_c0_g1_i1.p1  ORF type:complete len:329 (-),score=74.22 TRINITY_DN14041_c0_g1_i1:761-1747(-)